MSDKSAMSETSSDDSFGAKSEEKKIEHLGQMKIKTRSENLDLSFEQCFRVQDCVFVVGKPPGHVRFGLHRVVLEKASPVLGDMLSSVDLENKNEIPITDIRPEVFKYLMMFLYRGSLEIATLSVRLVEDLCLAADKYKIVSLTQTLCQQLEDFIEPSSACLFLHLARQLNLNQLVVDKARKILIERTDEVLSFNTINSASPDIILELVQEETLHIDSETVLIAACMSWAEQEVARKCLTPHPEGYKQALGPILQHLRFYAISVRKFGSLLPVMKCFSMEEKLTMIEQIANKQFSTIPHNLSQSHSNRNKTAITLPHFVLFDENHRFHKPISEACFLLHLEAQSCAEQNCVTKVRTNPRPGFSCCLSIKVDKKIHCHGLVFSSELWNFQISVLNENDLPICIGSNHHVDDEEVMFEFPFLMNENVIYTIVVISDSKCCYERFNSQMVVAVEGDNLFNDISYAPNPGKSDIIVPHIMYKIA